MKQKVWLCINLPVSIHSDNIEYLLMLFETVPLCCHSRVRPSICGVCSPGRQLCRCSERFWWLSETWKQARLNTWLRGSSRSSIHLIYILLETKAHSSRSALPAAACTQGLAIKKNALTWTMQLIAEAVQFCWVSRLWWDKALWEYDRKAKREGG